MIPSASTGRCTRWCSRSPRGSVAVTYFDHKMVSVLIGDGNVLVIGLVTRRLAGSTAALVAAVLAAFYPNLWVIDTVLFPEGLFALLTTLVILCRLPMGELSTGMAGRRPRRARRTRCTRPWRRRRSWPSC